MRTDHTVCVGVRSIIHTTPGAFHSPGQSVYPWPLLPHRFPPRAPAVPLFWTLPPSSSRLTTGTRSTPLLGHTLSGVYSTYKSKCLSPFVPGSPPSVSRLCAPTRDLASIYPSWVQVCPPLSKESTPCSTCPHTAAGSSPTATVIVCASAPTQTLPDQGLHS